MLDLEMGGHLSNFPDVPRNFTEICALKRYISNFFDFDIYFSGNFPRILQISADNFWECAERISGNNCSINHKKSQKIIKNYQKIINSSFLEVMSSEGSSRPVRAAFYFGTRWPCLGCAAGWLCAQDVRPSTWRPLRPCLGCAAGYLLEERRALGEEGKMARKTNWCLCRRVP